MITGILHGAPIWVWPLLVLLLFVGWHATRDRSTRVRVMYMLPILGALAVNAVYRLPMAPWVWGVFVLAYVFGTWFGFGFQGKVIRGKSDGKVHLSGEWLTFLALMCVFWMNFTAGITQAISVDVYTSTLFHIIFACIEGGAAGSFLGRALRVYKTPDDKAA